MTWRADAAAGGRPGAANGGRRHRQAGFTLLEMIIVLVILGLAVGIAVSRGPPRSHGLEVRGLVAAVAEALRGARGRAIATNRTVLVAVNGERGSLTVAGGPTIQVPLGLDLSAALPGGEPGKKLIGIRFAPDGSASGGRIVLADGKRHTQIGVDWLTGRISVADAP
jgi:general secretion pathway protein H